MMPKALQKMSHQVEDQYLFYFDFSMFTPEYKVPVVPADVKVVIKETLPGAAWRDSHQLPLAEQPGQLCLAVSSTPELGGEHL